VKKQLYFSFVLATLSFIATRALQDVGFQYFYEEKANNFHKEEGELVTSAPLTIYSLPMGLSYLEDMNFIDSTSIIGKDENGNVLFVNFQTGISSRRNLLNSENKLIDIAKVDSVYFLFDDANQLHVVKQELDTFSLVSTHEINNSVKPVSVCLHENTKRILFLNEAVEHEDGTFSSSIYGMTTNSKVFREKPVFEIHPEEIENYALENNIILPLIPDSETGKSVERLAFHATSISVHPKTNEIYVLSDTDHSIAIFNQFGEVVGFFVLNPMQFGQPKSLSFQPNGDLLISTCFGSNCNIAKVSWKKMNAKKANQNALLEALTKH
jgi:hypothetical protein